MVSFNLKVLVKFGLCSNRSQKLHGCSLARARKILQLLACSFKCTRLREISLVLLCSYFLYINDKSVMTWLRQKGWTILTFGFDLSSIAQPVTVVEAQQVFRLLFYSLSYFIGAAGFLLSKVLAARKKNLSNARARKNKYTASMLAKTILYPIILVLPSHSRHFNHI